LTELMLVVGTRPEIIKMAPVIRELQKRGLYFTFVQSGQHYDYNLSKQFIKELRLPEPNYSFKLNNSESVAQMSEIMLKLKEVIKKEKPKLLLIEGDTNSVVTAALTGLKMGVKIGHVEAGLRSYDWRMPEEHNRIIVDHISDLLFAPTDRARENLERENVHGKIYVTGNTVIDAVIQHMPLAEENSKIINKIRFGEYILMTAHRAENVDDPNVLKNFVEVCIHSPLPIVFPVHPRTAKRLKEYGLYNILKRCGNVQLLPPVGYLDFLMLMKHCKLILSDSGGLQEEATAPCIKKKVLVLRLSTERPEAIEEGFAKLVGIEKDIILQSIKEEMNSSNPLNHETPFGDGNASRRIINIIEQYVGSK